MFKEVIENIEEVMKTEEGKLAFRIKGSDTFHVIEDDEIALTILAAILGRK